MVDEPVGYGHSHRLIQEDTAPFTKRMVDRNNQAPSLVSMSNQLEQAPRFYIVPFDIAKVVYHYHPVAIQLQKHLHEAERSA